MKKCKTQFYALASKEFENALPDDVQNAGGFVRSADAYHLGLNTSGLYFAIVDAAHLMDFYIRYYSLELLLAKDLTLINIEIPKSADLQKVDFIMYGELSHYYLSDEIIVTNIHSFLEDVDAMKDFLDHVELSRDKDTLFHLACKCGNLDVVKYLFDRLNIHLRQMMLYDPHVLPSYYKDEAVYDFLTKKHEDEMMDWFGSSFGGDTIASAVRQYCVDMGVSMATTFGMKEEDFEPEHYVRVGR